MYTFFNLILSKFKSKLSNIKLYVCEYLKRLVTSMCTRIIAYSEEKQSIEDCDRLELRSYKKNCNLVMLPYPNGFDFRYLGTNFKYSDSLKLFVSANKQIINEI